MRLVDVNIHLSDDEYDHARALSRGIRDIIRRMPLTNLLTETDGPVRFRGPFKGKMTAPSFILLVVEALAQLKEKKETEVADQKFQNFANFFEVRGVRDKRYEEGTIGA
ncbi:MAG: TatD family hydrolase [Candidatus Bathyarchaeota archaeon]|nr:TatD family hydrolase [Candidatus Bathyarchaeota archaeon]MDH5663251.1 TatD family hydrolase [Candidatus Bathyarchaeota archaeon]